MKDVTLDGAHKLQHVSAFKGRVFKSRGHDVNPQTWRENHAVKIPMLILQCVIPWLSMGISGKFHSTSSHTIIKVNKAWRTLN